MSSGRAYKAKILSVGLNLFKTSLNKPDLFLHYSIKQSQDPKLLGNLQAFTENES